MSRIRNKDTKPELLVRKFLHSKEIQKLKGENEIDLIIGGPPCQAYSLIGRARDKDGMVKDKRNLLYIE